jgi:hypothetical protein
VSGDQQFILALVALVLNGVGLVLNYRKSDSTHQLVNGMTPIKHSPIATCRRS